MKTSFAVSCRPMKSDEMKSFASEDFLSEAKSLIPEHLNDTMASDLLPVVFNVAVVNKFNRNGAGINTDDAIEIVNGFINKPINIEHMKMEIVGHMVSATLTDEASKEFNINEAKDFEGRTDTFYIAAAGVIYKSIYPSFAEFIEDEGGVGWEGDVMSASWEVSHSDLDIYKGSQLLASAEKVDDAEKEVYRKFLLTEGGEGFDESGNPVFYKLSGKKIPKGVGFTMNPAADVKGIFPQNEEEGKEYISQNNKTSVSDATTKSKINDMTPEEIKQLVETTLKEANSQEQVSEASVTAIHKVLEKAGENWVSKVDASKKEAQEAKDSLAELQTKFDEVEKTLNEMKDSEEARATAEKFNGRIQEVKDEFELSEAEQKIVVKRIQGIDSDEDFASYKEELNVIFADKSKEAIAKAKKEADKTAVASTQTMATEDPEKKAPVSTASSDNTPKTLAEEVGDEFKISIK